MSKAAVERAFDRVDGLGVEALGFQRLVIDARRVLQAAMSDRVARDGADRFVVIAQRLQRRRGHAVDDLEVTAAGQLLEFDQREIGLDSGGVAVHHQTDRAGRRDHGGLRVAIAVPLAKLERLVPSPPRRRDQARFGAIRRVQRHRQNGQTFVTVGRTVRGAAVIADHAQHVLAIGGVTGKGAELAGHLGRGGVADTGHHRGDGGAQRAAGVAVIGQAHRHQQARRYWRSRGRVCGIRRTGARFPAMGTAPSAPRFRA